MTRSIFLIQPDDSLVELTEEDYDSEEVLQQLLAQFPKVLTGGQEGSPAWLLIEREAGIPKEQDGGSWWSLDHLFVDRNAVPTLVEVKRKSDTRLRREVVAQMLDYAANAVVYLSDEGSLRSRFERRCEKEGLDPDRELLDHLGDDISWDKFWEDANTNLEASRIRMVFVADEIPPELLRVVEFLNEQMRTVEVLAVEVRQYVGGSQRTLVPQVLGQTAETQLRKTHQGDKNQWDEDRFFTSLATRRSAEVVSVARELYEWCQKQKLSIWFGRGTDYGGWVPRLYWKGVKHQLFEIWSTGKLETFFQWYAGKEPFKEESLRLELLDRFNSIEGADLPRDSITRRPTIDLELFVDRDARESLLETLAWVIERIRST